MEAARAPLNRIRTGNTKSESGHTMSYDKYSQVRCEPQAGRPGAQALIERSAHPQPGLFGFCPGPCGRSAHSPPVPPDLCCWDQCWFWNWIPRRIGSGCFSSPHAGSRQLGGGTANLDIYNIINSWCAETFYKTKPRKPHRPQDRKQGQKPRQFAAFCKNPGRYTPASI